MYKVVAIDGPSGAGKSTIARMLAKEIGFEFLDTGALYRAVALGLVENGLDEDVGDDSLIDALKRLKIDYRDGCVFLNGVDVSVRIRDEKISHYSSVFSARKAVRASLLDIQKSAPRHADIVVEGRDTTTVVFPHAWRKFYLTASVRERAKRRYLQIKDDFPNVTIEEIESDLERRDERDMNRIDAPLTLADGAILLDTSHLTIRETLDEMIKGLAL